MPWDYDLTCKVFEGLFISDGPDNPEASEATIRHLHEVTEGRPSRPIFGIERPSLLTQVALWPSWISRCCGSPLTSPARRVCPCSATCSLVWMRPWDYDLTGKEFHGLFISDGPGNPETCEATIRHLHKVTEGRPSLPIFGIFLGHQLLALTAGAKTAA